MLGIMLRGQKWLPGRIVESSGNALFTVVLMDGRQVRKHTDQLIRRYVDSTVQPDGEQLDYDDTSVNPNEDPTNTAPTVYIPPDTPELPVDTNTTPTVDIPPDTPILLLILHVVRLHPIVHLNLLIRMTNRAETLLHPSLVLVVHCVCFV